MSRSRRTMVVLAVVLALAAGLVTTAGTAEAKPRRASLTTALRELKNSGMYYGHSYAKITKFSRFDQRKYGTRWIPTIKVIQVGGCRVASVERDVAPNSQPCAHPTYGKSVTLRMDTKTVAALQRAASHPTAKVMLTDVHATPMRAATWYNPLSWNWSKILGWSLNHLLKKCASGAAAGLVGNATRALATKMLVRGSTTALTRLSGPEGYAVAALAGCMFGLTFGNL